MALERLEEAQNGSLGISGTAIVFNAEPSYCD